MVKTPLKEKIILGSIFGLLIIASVIILFNSSKIEPIDYDSLTTCLASKNVVMYGSETCGACNYQKQLFGDSFKKVNYVDCPAEMETCQKAGITAYPTWIIDGQAHQGARDPNSLAELAGC